jgi:hypothetical protein
LASRELTSNTPFIRISRKSFDRYPLQFAHDCA